MTPDDLVQVLALQQRCYPLPYHEPLSAFDNKLQRSPGSAWIALASGQTIAYLVTLPVDEAHFPALHADTWQPPERARWLYLHDLAVDPDHRGSGAGQRLIERALALAQQRGLGGLALVAVQGSEPYWARQGFQPQEATHPALIESLRSFGDGARFMVRV
jgi:GNAT superfamily N-acetyltransferase